MSDASLRASMQEAAIALQTWQDNVNCFIYASAVTFSAEQMDRARECAHGALDAYLDAIGSTNAELRRLGSECR